MKKFKQSRKEISTIKRWRLREEMKIRVLETLYGFKSQEEPRLKVTDDDMIHVLSSIIARRTA